MTSPSYDAVIIGAGTNGLVAATVLAKAGLRVLCIERGATVGGQSRLIEIAPGFQAPIGTEADWVPPAAASAVGLAPVDFTTTEIPTTVALPGGGFLSLSSRVSEATAAIRAHSGRDADRWGAFTTTMRGLAGFLEALYQLPPPDLDSSSVRDLPSLVTLGRSFRALGKANMSELLRVLPIPAQDLADDWFTFGPLKAAIGAAAVRDIRQGPRSGGTSFVLLHYLTGAAAGAIRGRPALRGGPNAVVDACEKAARQHGVSIRTGLEVARIVVRDDATTGVTLSTGEEILASMVLSTADASQTFLQLVDPVWLDPEFLLAVRNIKFRGSTALVHYALDRLPDAPGLADPVKALAGVVSLTGEIDAIEKAYDAAKYGRLSENPHIEISVPSIRWSQLAPPGKHVLVATVRYAPHRLRDGAWDAARSMAVGDAVTAAIARVMPRFGEAVVQRSVITPADLESRFGLTDGAVTQGEITLDQILFMRPVAGWGQYSTPIDGLYLGGAGSHPGPGVLGGAGFLAARRMLADSNTRKRR